MKKYAYVRCVAIKTEPGHNAITGRPVVDVVPDVWAGGMSFSHAIFEAKSLDQAYELGLAYMPPLKPGVIAMNDYAFEI